jgi:hypothetical protein
MSLACLLAVATVDDDCNHICLDSTHNTRLLLWRIQERSLLIVVVSKSVHPSKYRPFIEESLDTIEQCKFRVTSDHRNYSLLAPLFVVCLLMANLHLVSRLPGEQTRF